MTRLRFLLSAVLFWVALDLRPGAAAVSSPPNVLLILADDLGYGDLSCYGAQDLQTPHLDALARSGMRWTQFYANCPVCSPTRAALLTGRYPDLAGVPGVIRTHEDNNWGYLSAQAVLLPARLKKAGYHTALVGKWHLGLTSPNTPTERGFDFFHGFLGDMMDDYYNHRRHGFNYMRRNEEEIDPEGHATDLFTQWAMDYLNDRKQSPDPWFLYLAYNAPHTPIQPPPDWLENVRARRPNLDAPRARLVALIEHLDHGIGRVLETLRANGQDRKTLVIFTSDNGGQLNVGANCGPLRGGKQDMFEGGIRVPFCAAWPGQIPSQSESHQVALTMDLSPTLCAAAGLQPDREMDGISILNVLTGSADPLPLRDLFWMRREGGRLYRGRDYYAMRRGEWKLVQNHPFEAYQLFNLLTDPQEQNDLAKAEPARLEELARALQRHIQQAGVVPWQGDASTQR